MNRICEEAAALFREVGDAGGEIEAGLIALDYDWGNGNVRQLVEKGDALIARAQEIGDTPRELLLFARVAPALRVLGEYERGNAYLARAEELVVQLATRAPGWMRGARCARARLEGDLAASLECYADFAEQARIEQAQRLLFIPMRNTAEIHAFDRHDYAAAAPLAREGLALSHKMGDSWNRAELTGVVAVCTAAEGDAAEADRLIAEAEAFAARGDVFAIAFVAQCRAYVTEIAERGEVDVEAAYLHAHERFATTEYTRGPWHAALLLDFASYLVARGRAAEAERWLDEALTLVPPQRGERAAQIAKLRERIATVKAAR